MSTNIITHERPAVKVVPQTRFVAKSEFEQGKYAYRLGWKLEACGSDEMADGWLYCEAHGEAHGWMRSHSARGADAYYRAMMAQASTEVM